MVPDDHKNQQQMNQYDYKAKRTLGVALTPDGKYEDQLQKLSVATVDWVQKLNTALCLAFWFSCVFTQLSLKGFLAPLHQRP